MKSVKQINSTEPGLYQLETASGSHYELIITPTGASLRRVFANEMRSLRADDHTIRILKLLAVQVGRPAQIILEPLGAGNGTLRITTAGYSHSALSLARRQSLNKRLTYSVNLLIAFG